MDTIVSILILLKNKLTGFGGRVQTLQSQVMQLIGKVASVKTTADAANTKADEAKTDATSAIQTAGNAATTAGNAVTTANAASTTATAASTTATAASTKADEAKSNATSALSAANSAATTATAASNNASEALTKVNEAAADIETLETSVSDLDSRVDALEETITTGVRGYLNEYSPVDGTTTTLYNLAEEFDLSNLVDGSYLIPVMITNIIGEEVPGHFKLNVNGNEVTVNHSDLIVVKIASGVMSYLSVQRNNASEWQKTVKDGFQALVDVLDANDIPLGNNQQTIADALANL